MKAVSILSLLLAMIGILLFAAPTQGTVSWQHPAGLVTRETIAEIKAKIEAHDWAGNADCGKVPAPYTAGQATIGAATAPVSRPSLPMNKPFPIDLTHSF